MNLLPTVYVEEQKKKEWNKLEVKKIYYKLNKVRAEAIMVEVAVPGQRWEIEFMDDDTVEVEKFVSDGDYYDGKELEVLLNDF